MKSPTGRAPIVSCQNGSSPCVALTNKGAHAAREGAEDRLDEHASKDRLVCVRVEDLDSLEDEDLSQRIREDLLDVLTQQAATIEREKMAAQRSVAADVAKIEAQLHQLAQQIAVAKSAAVQSELRLRNLLGLPPTDGFVITPSTAPLTAPITIDVAGATSTAIANRPDVIRQASMVKTRECELLLARNVALPQLDLLGLNRWNGVGGYWNNSLSQMASTEFVDYQASLTITAPIGLRAGAANIRAAVLQLEREKALMKQAIHSANHQVSSLAQEASYSLQLFNEADSRRKLNAEWLAGARIRFENPPPAGDDGDWLLVALNDYLLAMRSQSEANVDSQTLLARYNIALARLSEATGTILNEFDVRAEQDE